MFSFLRSHNGDDRFDLELDRDLVAACNEALSTDELDRITAMARRRLSARAAREDRDRPSGGRSARALRLRFS